MPRDSRALENVTVEQHATGPQIANGRQECVPHKRVEECGVRVADTQQQIGLVQFAELVDLRHVGLHVSAAILGHLLAPILHCAVGSPDAGAHLVAQASHLHGAGKRAPPLVDQSNGVVPIEFIPSPAD